MMSRPNQKERRKERRKMRRGSGERRNGKRKSRTEEMRRRGGHNSTRGRENGPRRGRSEGGNIDRNKIEKYRKAGDIIGRCSKNYSDTHELDVLKLK